MGVSPLEDPSQFFNRHLSRMQFNHRVLEEALDRNNPLLERVKFLATTASNLDEFVKVHLAGLLQQVEQGHTHWNANLLLKCKFRPLAR